MRKVDEDGVNFRSYIDGSLQRLTPEKSIQIQEKLGADIIMAFDECAAPYDRRTAPRPWNAHTAGLSVVSWLKNGKTRRFLDRAGWHFPRPSEKSAKEIAGRDFRARHWRTLLEKRKKR
jgi:tRNA-guanine family transglycosylase